MQTLGGELGRALMPIPHEGEPPGLAGAEVHGVVDAGDLAVLREDLMQLLGATGKIRSTSRSQYNWSITTLTSGGCHQSSAPCALPISQ
jgi:hypothetical protein